jgi:hypothetical protein
MRLGDLNRQAGDEVEDIQFEGSFTVGAVGIDAHRDAGAVIGDTRHHDGGSEHVSGDPGEGCLIIRRDHFPNVRVEAGMLPGQDKLHAFPAQKISPAQEPKDLDFKELPEHALIPGRQRVSDTTAVPSPRCHERVQVRVKPHSLAERMLDDRHRRSYTRPGCLISTNRETVRLAALESSVKSFRS